MKPRAAKTLQEAKADLNSKGISVRAWAIRNGFTPAMVHMILRGERGTRIGKSHRAAVMLGIKNGNL
jgi:gp16 family phage-associated protein